MAAPLSRFSPTGQLLSSSTNSNAHTQFSNNNNNNNHHTNNNHNNNNNNNNNYNNNNNNNNTLHPNFVPMQNQMRGMDNTFGSLNSVILQHAANSAFSFPF